MNNKNIVIAASALAIIGVLAIVLLKRRKMEEPKPTKEEIGAALESKFGVQSKPSKEDIGLALEKTFGVKKMS